MDSRGLCTLVVRAFGLWIVVSWFGAVWYPTIDLMRHLAGADPTPPYPNFSFWEMGRHVGSLLTFILGVYLLIDGKEMIDHFQYVTGRCGRCGYSLLNVRGSQCPECGAPISKRQGSASGSTPNAGEEPPRES